MKRKKIPYGIADFRTLIQSDCYYVDRTRFIKKLEERSNYLFFLRPRRFGKSLTISMLEYYYGLQFKDEFDSLFSGLYIGDPENTTAGKNNYFVLRFDFTGINTSNPDDIMASFNSKIGMGLLLFNDAYNLLDSSEFKEVSEQSFPATALELYLTRISPKIDKKIMILIDEYDHFTNEILSFNFDTFPNIVSKNGFVRKFYETIKYFAGRGIIERFFATGVTPVTLDSMTSGFNIGTNISTNAEFNDMTGFTSAEVELMTYDLLPGIEKEAAEKIVDDIAAWYNGSLFSLDATTRLYNPALVLRFFSEINPDTLKYPGQMVDTNIITDFSKIKNIIRLGNYEANLEALQKVLENGAYASDLTQIFTFEREFTVQDFVSILYYNGLLTIKGKQELGVLLQIPNYVIKEVFWEFFANEMSERNQIKPAIDELKNAVIAMGNSNDVLPIIKIVENILQNLSNRDFMNFDEKYIKLLFVVYVSLTKSYKIKSEQEVNQNYPDLLFLNSQNYSPKYQHLFEIKYLKKSDSLTLQTIKTEATEQTKRYKQLPEMMEINNLKFWVIIFTGSSCSEFFEVV